MAAESTVTRAQHDSRREQLLQAAEELVAVHGFDALRLRDVAAYAGVSIGMIQHHFTTRDGLLRETMRRASSMRVEQWIRLSQEHADAGEQLRTLLTGAIRDVHRCTVWIETCAVSTRHDEMRDDVRRTQQIWWETLREVVDRGRCEGAFAPRMPAAAIATILVKLIDGAALEVAVGGPEGQDLAAVQEQLLAAAAALLASE